MPGHLPIQSLQRAFDILFAIAGVDQGLTPRQIAEAVRLKPSTVYKFLHTLELEGFVVRRRKPLTFELGQAIPELYHLNVQSRLLSAATRTFYRAAAQADRGEFYLVEFIEGQGHVRLRVQAQGMASLSRPRYAVNAYPYARASNLIFLAFAPPAQVQEFYQKFPFETEAPPFWKSRLEFDAAISVARKQKLASITRSQSPGDPDQFFKIAAPVFRSDGSLMAAVGLSVPIELTKGTQRRLKSFCRETAKEITQRLNSIKVSQSQ